MCAASTARPAKGSVTPAVEAQGLTKAFGSGPTEVQALRGVDLSLRQGVFLAVMGPSGSGKSTLLHLVGGLTKPTSGKVLVGGQDLSALNDDALTLLRRRRIGFVFQFFNLLPILTALENVALPLIIDGVREAEATQRAAAAMELVGIAHRRGHRPGKLSGGEQQRVAVARALVTEPVLILADEPTGNLDSTTGDQVMALLRRLVDERGQTILMVTHDPRAAAMADSLLTLKDGFVAHEQRLDGGRSAGEILRELEGLS
ncbi:MAG: ABC transporter ATP-binding protein [Thermoleophilia bacterium]|nr:ABC transporter ATP-binding protein [Thermoleophilia bacterium]